MIVRIFYFCLVFVVVLAQDHTRETGKSELKNHFKIEDNQLESVSSLLLKMKKLAHRRVYGNREFGSDAVEDAKKPVAISVEQPSVAKEVSPFLFEGDIFLSKQQAIGILKQISHIEKKKAKRGRRSFVSDPDAKWMDTPIKYKFHESLDFYAVSQIIQGIRYWENVTCLVFENAPDVHEEEDFIEFFQGQGCYSMIGRNGGRQGVSIGENCVKLGVIEHEIGHALGLWHEQSRPDAQSYVKVQEDFILPSYVSDFLQRDSDIDTLGLPYDLGSVMHYGSTAFSADQTSKTLLTRDPLYQMTIGQRETLSFYDVQRINKAYCGKTCEGSATKCENGGYPHPGQCSECICPTGLGGDTCTEQEEPKNAECGSVISIEDSEWHEFASPGFPDPGYELDQKCSWFIKAPAGKRVELEFIEDFSFLCTSTCVDFVELKISSDFRNTGFRFCCYNMPNGTFVSEKESAVVVFRSTLTSDIGFKIRARSTDMSARTTPAPIIRTTTPMPTTIAGDDVWSDWGPWSQCSRSCGGCGIQSRLRTCKTKDCNGRRQEFSTCNLQACPVDKHCAKLLSTNRLCNGRVCTKATSSLSGCDQPTCCPPFYNNNGMCQSDSPIAHDFIA